MTTDMDYPDSRLLIAGQWRASGSGNTQPVRNPATGEVIGKVELAAASDLEDALSAAGSGFQIWRATAPDQRARLLQVAATLVRERADEMARVMVLEQGKRYAEARIESQTAADVIDWCAGETLRTYGRIIPARMPRVEQQVVKEPVGPVAAFTPWNFPVNQAVRKIAPALAAGCSVILKGPEETPASVALLVQAFVDAGVRGEVLNLVYGVPAEVSGALIPHPVIRKISFTGSTVVGKQLAELAGRHMKRITMELGGHAPVVICEDADLNLAVKLMMVQKFWNAGQTCISPTRFMVHERLFEPFVEAFGKAAEALKVGQGGEKDTRMGPLANSRRVEAVNAMVQDAVSKGAVLRTGGTPLNRPGYFFAPTILTDVPASARIMNEEPFGPVACVRQFSDMDEALIEANRLPYGLAAYGFARSGLLQSRLASEISSGMVAINSITLGLPELPFGGVNDSGYGSEGGPEAIEAFLNTKFVSVSR